MRTDGKLCCRYVDVATDLPELPVARNCSLCSLMTPAKRYNEHLIHRHTSRVFRCEECHSYLDKDDFLFHINKHGYLTMSDILKAKYYTCKKALLEDEALMSKLSQTEMDALKEYLRKTDLTMERRGAFIHKPGPEMKTNIQQSEESKENREKASKDTETTKELTSRSESDEVKTDRPPDSVIDNSPPKKKRVGLKRSLEAESSKPKRISEAESSPPKRQRKTKGSLVVKGGQVAKNIENRDDGNDGDDEVNTPKASPSSKAVKAKEDGTDKSPKGSRTCPICGKQYRASSSYFYHMKYFHKRSREHECSVCNKKFGTKANLAQHVSIHTGAYDLECKECGKRFKSKPSLYIHEQSHGGPKRWACAQCGRSFRWRTHLARHVTRHAAERAHVCATCGRGFSVRCDLLRHARTHTADEFHCATCGLKFAQKRYLQVHVSKKHPEAPSQVVTRS